MPACQSFLSRAVLLLLMTIAIEGFAPKPPTMTRASTRLSSHPETVEVCGNKDCKRGGGGPRLEKLVSQVLEEQGLTSVVSVKGCDCLDECGYGPNLVVDGKIVNGVKGKAAVLKALGIEQQEE